MIWHGMRLDYGLLLLLCGRALPSDFVDTFCEVTCCVLQSPNGHLVRQGHAILLLLHHDRSCRFCNSSHKRHCGEIRCKSIEMLTVGGDGEDRAVEDVHGDVDCVGRGGLTRVDAGVGVLDVADDEARDGAAAGVVLEAVGGHRLGRRG